MNTGAKRMQEVRLRRRLGLRCYTVELHESEVAALVRQGYLSPERQADRDAVLQALHAFIEAQLR
jgi:hypothetical protein